MLWVWLVLLYGLIKGAREIFKKKALTKNTVLEVLFFYTLLSTIMVLPEVRNAGGMTLHFFFWVAVKSFAIFLAWIFSFKAIDHLPVSLYGVVDMSRVLFATLLGVIVLGEVMGIGQIIGLILVLIGLLLLRLTKKTKNGTETYEARYVIYSIISCMLNAFSGLMDKILMKEMDDGQLQFWYMIFLLIYYAVYIIVTKTRLNWKTLVKNYWCWLLAIIFVIGDRALFIANADPNSKVTVMTLIKQSGCLVTILGGKFVFHEKNIRYKLICAAIIIAGIVISVAV